MPISTDALVLSLAAGDRVLDCRAGAYHPQMQAALAATHASLECAEDEEGLVLSVRPMVDAPPISVAKVNAHAKAVTLSWTDGDLTMDCRTLDSYEDLLAVTCTGPGVALEAVTLRRVWP